MAETPRNDGERRVIRGVIASEAKQSCIYEHLNYCSFVLVHESIFRQSFTCVREESLIDQGC